MAARQYGFGAPKALGSGFKADSDLSITGQGQDLVLAWTKSGKVMAARFHDGAWGASVDTGAQSNHGPAITLFGNKLYVLWTDSDKRIRYATLDSDSLKIDGDKLRVPGASSKKEVAAAVYKDTLYVLHIGDTTGLAGDTIYQITFDGTAWSKDQAIEKGQASNKGPVLLAVPSSRLFLFHRGQTDGLAGDTLYYSTTTAGGRKDWSENKGASGAETRGRPGASLFKNYVAVAHKGRTSDDLRLIYTKSDRVSWFGDERIGDGYASERAPALAELDDQLHLFFVKDGVINEGVSTFYLKTEILSAPFTVQQFADRSTPNNVAVCLSGGGSRALTAGMGQLLALETLTAGPEQASLLSQTRVLSTVSGGAWLGVTFTYNRKDPLPGLVAPDMLFLGGPYVSPPEIKTQNLGVSPWCIASNVMSGFSLTDLAFWASWLHEVDEIPADMLWQTMMGQTFLAPYGLFTKSPTQGLPASYFTYDEASADKIKKANPSMAAEVVDLVAQQPAQRRPFLICNMAMQVDEAPKLVPVQATPYFTGVVAAPPETTDANNQQVGKGGVTSFGFNSAPAKFAGSTVTIEQSRQWSLTDSIGTSSCAYAETLMEPLKKLMADPPAYAAALRERRSMLLQRLERADVAEKLIDAHIAAAERGAPLPLSVMGIGSLIPAYRYWPTTSTYTGDIVPTKFADGGNLENLGIAAALSYGDVDNVICFVNTNQPMHMENGMIAIDDAIPPLFGYQPFDRDAGYVPYPEIGAPLQPGNAVFKHNQIFPSDQFLPLVQALWEKSGDNQNSPIVKQSLVTVENKWFGVAGGKTVNVLWVLLQRTSAWMSQLSTKKEDGDESPHEVARKLVEEHSFPNYPTTNTELDYQQITMLANLTAWTVINAKWDILGMYGYRQRGEQGAAE